MSERTNLKIGGFPGVYVQGPGAHGHLAATVRQLGGRSPFVVSDDIVDAAIGARLLAGLVADGLSARRLRFAGECTPGAVAALAAIARGEAADTIVGLGGGKTIDTAKGVAKAIGARLVVAPTIASNDSATSRLIVLYDDTHRVTGTDLLTRNPDAVVVDTSEIVKAPVRFFRAGIGDALSKTFEARQCRRTGAHNFFGGRPTAVAQIFADRCYDIIRDHGETAVTDVARQVCSPDVETVTEATVLLSGVGFETGGLSIAHALIRGLTAVPSLSRALHGEMVAFGTLVQLVMEGEQPAELASYLELLRRVGLGAHWKALGDSEPTADELDVIAGATAAAPYAANFSPRPDAKTIRAALIRANALGEAAAP